MKTLGEPLAFDVLTYIGCGISIFHHFSYTADADLCG